MPTVLKRCDFVCDFVFVFVFLFFVFCSVFVRKGGGGRAGWIVRLVRGATATNWARYEGFFLLLSSPLRGRDINLKFVFLSP